MRLFGTTRSAVIGAFALCMALMFTSKSAFASARFDFGVGLGYSAPVYTAPVYAAPVYTAPVYSDGHYETRAQSVLVAPATCERRWADPVYETRYFNGQPQSVCVSQGGWHQFTTPARYETRYVQVWVPTTYAVVAAPRYYSPGYGSFFDFTYRNRRW
jgi:hypothetical protein